MYNRLFTKILDSSIWLEPLETRVVWITLLAAMDQDGFAAFACAENVARRSGVSSDATAKAIECLESPDPNSSDPENDGRRIERVPGGWIVLNAIKYRETLNSEIRREQTRARVARHRENKANVTQCNADVTLCNENVTPSETGTAAPAIALAAEKAVPPEERTASPRAARKTRTANESTKARGTLEDVEQFAVWLGMPKQDGTACFHKWEGNGWRNGSNAIKCWRSTLRAWKESGYLPSQKNGKAPSIHNREGIKPRIL